MRAINLLPRDAERTRSDGSRLPLLLVAGGAAAATAGMVVVFLSASGGVTDRRAELAAVEAAIKLVPTPPPSAVGSGTLVQERTDRVAALAAALSTRTPFDRLFRELSFVLPADAWLTGIRASVPASTAPVGSPPGGTPPAAAAAATSGVTIQGATYSHRSVARVLARLAVIPSIEDVRLTASARVEPEVDETKSAKARKKQKPVVTFTVSATIRTGSTS